MKALLKCSAAPTLKNLMSACSALSYTNSRPTFSDIWKNEPQISKMIYKSGLKQHNAFSTKGMLSFHPLFRVPPFPPQAALFDNVVQRRFFSRSSLDARKFRSLSILTIKKYLRQKNIEYSESHACLAIIVPKHILNDEEPPNEWRALDSALTKIYINKVTGEFVCPELAYVGEWKDLEEFISVWYANKSTKKGQQSQRYPKFSQLDLHTPHEVSEKWGNSLPVDSLTTKDFKELLKYLKLPVRDLKQEDFARFDVRVSQDHDQLIFPVRYASTSNLIGLRVIKWSSDGEEVVETNVPEHLDSSTSRIFPFPHGLDMAYKYRSKSVLLVTSVLDSVIIASNSSYVPVALGEGATSLPPGQLPFFEEFEKISLWFPNDPTSVESAKSFAKKLGEQRCYMVGRDFASPIFCLKKKDITIKDILKHRLKPCSHEFITSFDSLREDVFLELSHLEEVQGVKWKRFDGLNDLIGGFRRGELTVFTGKTGTGKTTFMAEYSIDLCMQGVTTLWGSFEVRNVRLAKMQLKQFSGINLEENLEQFDTLADKFQKLPLYYLTFHGAQEVDKVLDAMGHAVYIYDIAHVIIDNIQFMMGTPMQNIDRYYLQDLVIQKFRKFATLHNVHVTLVIHPRKEEEDKLTVNSIFGGAKATQEADNVLILQEESVTSRIKRKYIQLVKNRFSGDLGTIPLFFTKSTLTFSKKIYQKEKALGAKRRESPKVEQLPESEQLRREVLIDSNQDDSLK